LSAETQHSGAVCGTTDALPAVQRHVSGAVAGRRASASAATVSGRVVGAVLFGRGRASRSRAGIAAAATGRAVEMLYADDQPARRAVDCAAWIGACPFALLLALGAGGRNERLENRLWSGVIAVA